MASTNRSYVQCLICNSSVELEEIETSAKSSTSSLLLEQNLQVYFILRHLLELPFEQLESYLRNCPSNLEDWVKICKSCRIGYVRKCENIFTELLEVKRRLRKAQLELIGVIKKSVNGNICERGGANCGDDQGEFILDMYKEIRRFVEERKYKGQEGDPFVTGDILAREKLAREIEIQPDEIREEKEAENPLLVSSKSHFRHHGNDYVDVVKMEVESPKSNIIGTEECPEYDVDYDDLDTEYSPEDGNFNDEDKDADLKSSEASEASSSEDNYGDNYTKCHSFSVSTRLNYKTRGSLRKVNRMSMTKLDKITEGRGNFTCEECSKSFSTKTRLRLHSIRTHKSNFYTCPECNYKTKAAHILELHMKKQHPGKKMMPKPLRCSEDDCSQTFNTDTQLRQHQIRVHKVNYYLCSKCEHKCTTQRLLNNHMKRFHGDEKDLEDLKCPNCQKISASSRNLKCHLRLCQNHDKREKYKCEHCDKAYLNKSRYLDHLGSVHKIKNENLRYTCSFEGCGKSYSKRSSLAAHEDLHKPPQYECKLCGEAFKRKWSFQRHMRQHETRAGEVKPFQCHLCPVRYAREDNLKKHMKKFHSSSATDAETKKISILNRKLHKCSECDLTFAIRAKLQRHMDKMHPGILNPHLLQCPKCPYKSVTSLQMINHKKENHQNDNEPKVNCPFCEKTLTSKYKLRVHISSKHINRKRRMFKCQDCDKEYSSRQCYYSHLASFHGNQDQQRFICSVEGCGKVFYFKNLLKLHENRKHNDSLKYNCEFCGETLSSEKDLRNHIKCQHDEKIEKESFLCEFCPEKYDTKNGLNRHMKYSHGKETGKFPCFICGKLSASQRVLQNHIEMIHERKYEMACDICGKMMVSRHYMKRHKAKVHNIGAEKFQRFPCSVEGCSRVFESDSKRRLHIRVKHDGARPYQCDICEKKISSKTHLRRHMQVMHSTDRESKPWKCEECGKGFAVNEYLWLHKKTHQKKTTDL